MPVRHPPVQPFRRILHGEKPPTEGAFPFPDAFLTSEDHVVWDCKYHVVIVPKCRKKVLYGPVKVQIGKIIRALAGQKEIEVLEGNACPDHMHMVLRIPPKHSVPTSWDFSKGKVPSEHTTPSQESAHTSKRVSGVGGTSFPRLASMKRLSGSKFNISGRTINISLETSRPPLELTKSR